jgi:hypothetical protein
MNVHRFMLIAAVVVAGGSNLRSQSQPITFPPGNTTLYMGVAPPSTWESLLPFPFSAGSRVTVPSQEHVVMILPSGVSPIQWTKDGVAIPGATGQTLDLSGVTTADSGKYNILSTSTVSGTGITLNVAPQGNFANFSALLTLAPGANTQTVGFVIGGISSKTILIRAVGQSLKSFGISNPAGRPVFHFFGSGNDGSLAFLAPITPDGWLSFFASVYAFPLTGIANGGDACIITILRSGAYTVQVSDDSLQGGMVLFEVYDMPAMPDFSVAGLVPISTTPGIPLGN